jgi:hypothetical protein
MKSQTGRGARRRSIVGLVKVALPRQMLCPLWCARNTKQARGNTGRDPGTFRLPVVTSVGCSFHPQPWSLGVFRCGLDCCLAWVFFGLSIVILAVRIGGGAARLCGRLMQSRRPVVRFFHRVFSLLVDNSGTRSSGLNSVQTAL